MKADRPNDADEPESQFKQALKDLTASLHHVPEHYAALEAEIKLKISEAENLKRKADEEDVLEQSRDLMAKGELEAALRELEKVEILHQEKFTLHS